jgi:hypothetical protein
MGIGAKRPGLEADHSFPSIAEVKNMWIEASSALYALIAYCLISYAQGQICPFSLPLFPFFSY